MLISKIGFFSFCKNIDYTYTYTSQLSIRHVRIDNTGEALHFKHATYTCASIYIKYLIK